MGFQSQVVAGIVGSRALSTDTKLLCKRERLSEKLVTVRSCTLNSESQVVLPVRGLGY